MTAPVYPIELKKAHISGRVVVEFIIGADGSVKKAQVLQTAHPGFIEPVLAAVYQWKYQPGIKNGRLVSSRVQQELYFDWDEPEVASKDSK